MAIRTKYETKGGHVSESDTFAKLTEHLRLAAEDCYTIGHLRKANDEELTGSGFLAIGQMLEETCKNVTKLIIKSARLKQ